jgi:cytochrome c-type biogenesis protein CcmF
MNLKEVVFNNEALWLGNLGQFFIVLTTVACLGALWYYYKAASNLDENSKAMGRRLFYTQALAVLGVFVMLFIIIFKHRYEYYYAWRHSSNALPVYYMISCFWEGQEGSFLLWMFWNAVLGVILTRSAGKWEAPVMTVIAFVQLGLSTMLLGLGQGDAGWKVHIGSSPFDLLREQRPDFLQIPILAQMGVENYLQIFKDGNGLNQLLQNYWMVIHPPTLFFGFATAMVPFAYSIAGLWMKEDRGWISPALIWSLICVGVLGTGIIMGGFWAYESLSFGGYWAWDPVENASLMPWLIMASAAHMLLIAKGTGRHLFASHLLAQLSFWLVLYATFLTRSGILGEASVHSFTDLGLSGQLLIFLFAVLLLSFLSVLASPSQRHIALASFATVVVLFSLLTIFSTKPAMAASVATITKWSGIVLFLAVMVVFIVMLNKRTRQKTEDEKWMSRELWMFIGAMFLILSLVQVFSATSIPVFNKLFGFAKAPARAEDYNAVQLWLAMPVMLLMAIGQYFRWRDTPISEFRKEVSISTSVALVLTLVLNFSFGILAVKYLLFLFLAVLLFTANLLYIQKLKKFSWLSWGGSIAHAGFGILLAGVLVSSANQKVLTASEGIRFASELNSDGKADEKAIRFNRENMLLNLNVPVKLGDFEATYRGYVKGSGVDSIDKYFNVHFVSKDKDGNIKDSFTLKPKTQNNPKMGLLAEPSTRHYISRDIFTHVNFESSLEKQVPFSGFAESVVRQGETFLSGSGKVKMTILKVDKLDTGGAMGVKLLVKAVRLKDSALLQPIFIINANSQAVNAVPVISNQLGLILELVNIEIPAPGDPPGNVRFMLKSGERPPQSEYIVVKAIEFPWINLVWAGTIIMVVGFAMAVSNRVVQQRFGL